MENLIHFQREDVLGLLSPELPDTCPEDRGTIQLDPTKRTIFIGLGGSGVKTLDRLKGELMGRAAPNWRNYASFLAIDEDWTELRDTAYLTEQEKLCVVRPGFEARMRDPMFYPPAVRRFMPDQCMTVFVDHYAKSRLLSKCRIHDQVPGKAGVDEEIVHRLQFSVANMVPLPPGGSSYQIYVIAGLGGNFGSGTITELPALIHRALGPLAGTIRAVAYLPDMMAALNPVNAQARLRANAVAALKELNYYQGNHSRDGFWETFSCNDPASPELRIPSDRGFYERIFLVDDPWVPNPRSQENAITRAAEYLTAELTGENLWPPAMPFFEWDPADPELEAPGCAHEFPRSFVTLGMAEARVPSELLRAVALGRICRKAGLKPVPAEHWPDHPAGMMPFRGEDQRYNAVEGTQIAQQLLAPVERIHREINNANFDLYRDLRLDPAAVTWDDIRAGKFDGGDFVGRCAAVVEERTNGESPRRLEYCVEEAFQVFRSNVQTFVMQNGPYAFADLFHGRFKPVEDNCGMGIMEMLCHLADGCRMDGRQMLAPSTQHFEAELRGIRHEIGMTRRPIIDIQKIMERQKNIWVDSINRFHGARIIELRRRAVLGRNGILAKEFIEPARELAEQLSTFGDLLCGISDLYGSYADKADVYQEFVDMEESPIRINAAAFDPIAHQWFLERADQIAGSCNLQVFRNQLVNAFFNDPQSWLEVPEEWIRPAYRHSMVLKNRQRPIPAREKFDRYANTVLNLPVHISIEELMEELETRGVPYNRTAGMLMRKLKEKGQLPFRGTVKHSTSCERLAYPSALDAKHWLGTAILCESLPAGFLPADLLTIPEEDVMRMRYAAVSMEVYRIYDLNRWEEDYEQLLPGSEMLRLHGKSPDVVCEISPGGLPSYREGQSWEDYPSIVYRAEPEQPDPDTGEICREGRNRLRLREEIGEARKLGALFSQQDAGGRWTIRYASCGPELPWQFDPTLMDLDLERGQLPCGRALVEAVAQQNHVSLWSMTGVVQLNNAGIFSMDAATEERAWDKAARVLRTHHPLMIRIRRTMDLFRQWMDACEAMLREHREARGPAIMVNLMKAGILYQEPNGTWYWQQEDGRERRIALYTERMMMYLPDNECQQVTNGLMSYWLFRQVKAAMSGEILMQENQRALQRIREWTDNDDQEALAAGAARAAIVETEREALRSKGAGTGEEPCSGEFVSAMEDLEPDPEELRKIERFYYLTEQA